MDKQSVLGQDKSTPSQMDALKALKKYESGTAANKTGIFVFLLGVLVLLVGPAGYFSSLSDAVAPSNKIGVGGLIWGVAIGLPLSIIGHAMIRRRRKIKADDVSESLRLQYVVSALKGSELIAGFQSADVTISSKGLDIIFSSSSKTRPLTISWPEITKTGWHNVYNHDSYQIDTKDGTYVFSAGDLIKFRGQARRYWLTAVLAPKPVANIYALKIVSEGVGDIRKLTPLHIYARSFSPATTTKWSNYFDYLLFTRLFGLTFLAVPTIWLQAYSQASGNSSIGPIAIITAIVLGFGSFLYRGNKELKTAQKLTNTKHF